MYRKVLPVSYKTRTLQTGEPVSQLPGFRGLKIIVAVYIFSLLVGCAAAPANHREDTWFGTDKYAHFLLSGIASAAIAKAAKEDGKDNCDAAIIGIGITLSLGAAKESYDKRYKKTLYSPHDMVWNLAGSTIGSIAGSNCH